MNNPTTIDVDKLVAPASSSPLTPLPTFAVKDGYFNHTDECPEGCQVISDLDEDDFGYEVDIQQMTYATRTLADGSSIDLPLWVFEPGFDNNPEAKLPDGGWPVIVFVRGSAFHEQDVLKYSNFCVRIAEQGYVVATLKYRQSDIAPFPAQMQDCKTAVRFIRKNAKRFHANDERIALWGDSSGGHTVLMAGFTGDHEPDTDEHQGTSAEVKAIVDWYGPTDFAKMNYYPSSQNHSDADSPEGFEIGHVDVLQNPERNREASPMSYLSADRPTPPTLIMHGGRDQLVPFNQSCRLYETMKALGKDVTFIKLDNACHAFRGFRSTKAINIVLDWLSTRV
ncbi:alpha/beta hydrolase [Bifidobacterium sp. ESL0690]|uniref:alpha/beta hydrolase n=1 Tax=Bifidobacterium sp. ESL0690 TaxID=2983214 RepID=UPI0023F761B4|nr:alpha/beta hydrolase [Bifidobacterium sp. ESL0690]WEV47269.1 alpha/beta hydrolase [Bifidobacterium sp. ESL0690]